jgi:hypothetical protein
MSKIRTIQSALNAGELSPKLRGRTDIPRYQHGLELCRNAIPMVWGGAQRTPGTRFVATASGSSVRLIDFPVSINGALAGYVLELGELTLRIHRNGSQIMSGGVPYSITTPYPAAILQEIRYAASANTLYLFHPLHFPKRFYRTTSDTDWVLEDLPLYAVPFMRPPNSEGVILRPSATSGTIVITASYVWFTADMVGLQLQINGGTVQITAITDAQHAISTTINSITPNPDARTIQDLIVIDSAGVPNGDFPPVFTCAPFTLNITALANYTDTLLTTTPDAVLPAGVTVTKTTVKNQLTGTEQDSNWKEQAWSALRGYPACGTFFEQRLVLGGSPTYPTYGWGSKSGEPLSFTLGTLDNEAWAFNLSAAETSLFHLVGTDNISVFAGDKELTMRGGSDSPITPSNVQVKSRTPHGTSLVRPVKIGGEIYFVPPSGLKLRGMVYQFSTDSYAAPDVALIAEHLIADGGGIRSMAYAREPYNLLWVVTSNGTLLTLTLDKEQEVTAWAKHGTDNDRYMSCVAVAGTDGIDRVWFAVQRLVSGTWHTFVEILDTTLQTNSSITASGTLTEVTGLGHLEGCLVDIKADGFYGGRVAVTGGKVTLATTASNVEVGLPYHTTIKDLPLELVNPGQSIQGAATAVNKIRVRLHESEGCTVNGEQVPFRRFASANSPVEPFSGDKQVFNLGRGTDPEGTQVMIEQDLPYALTVLAIIKEVNING